LNIINPNFKIQEDNIFSIRRKDYENILPAVEQIVKPVEEIGFVINEISLKDSRFSSGELLKTIKQTLVIKLQKGSSNIDLSIFIPKLTEDNYIIINGRKKIPLFQLFDIPVVTRGANIKLRTNVATLMVFKDKDPPYVKLSFLGKKVSLALFLLACYGIDEVTKRFELETEEIKENSDVLYENLLEDLKIACDESMGYTQDDFVLEIGKIYSKFAAKSKGEDIMYALDLIPKVDIITSKFLNTDSILEEIILSIKTDQVDDTLFTNKRIRCFEYMVTAKVSKIIFDLCFSNRTARQPKFNISSTQILSECNISDIVQFDFSINPVEELTKLSRLSLLGPGGFKRENIPKHLRDIYPSMFGRVCPVDTPDRDNCGVLQNLLPNVKLDQDLRFTGEILDKSPVSIPVSMTPFLQNDDQTRLQMAASQMRQAIMLRDFDSPLIKSGCEDLYTDQTQFVKRAKQDGEVIYVDNQYIIVAYVDGSFDIFDINSRKIYVEHLDFMKVYINAGDKFKSGDILAESNFCKDGSINIGRNLLTGVMVHYGNNYEDGIVISDRLQKEKIFTSVHYKDLSFNITPDKVLLSLDSEKYKPLPEEFEKIKIGDPYAIIKKLNSDDFYSVFSEEFVLEAKKNFLISDVDVFANSWNTEIPEYKDWIETRISTQQEKENNLQKVIKDHLPKEQAMTFIRENNLDKFSFVEKYKEKRERINGVNFHIVGIHFRQIQVGDKIANRHGNKGVISKIIPHEKMPKLEDGRNLDICINPLGIISRMNVGQIYELHLSKSFEDLKQNMLQMLKEKLPQKQIKDYLKMYIEILDKTKTGWYYKQFTDQIPKKIDEQFIDELTLIQPPFESSGIKQVTKAMEYTGTDYKFKLFDPVSKVDLLNKIAVGYIYFFRMVHIAEEKLAARGIGAYARRTLQPLGGRKNKGGQRCGEMETACLIGHDAPVNLFEFFTTKSDCIDLKNNYIRNVIESDFVEDEKQLDSVPESVKLLNAYLTVIGVEHK
jgi:hypothetical protein